MPYCRIAVNAPLPLLTYSCEQDLPIGTRVSVPFRGKTVIGVVWENSICPDIDLKRILPVQTVWADGVVLPQQWLDLVSFAARYYHYPIGQTAFAAMPQGLKDTQSYVLPPLPKRYALTEIGRQQNTPPKRAMKQVALWQALFEAEAGCSWKTLKQIHGGAARVLDKWIDLGWVDDTDEVPVLERIPPSLHQLNIEQTEAVESIKASLGQFQTFLLYGITGSGKTEVYFDAIAHTLEAGKQVLFLLPEIGLTPQLLKRLSVRFGEVSTVVLHSQTAAKKRSDGYVEALLGRARLVVGTRLSVFTPMPDLGLIVVDEEHDASFKQENELRYHARDLAVWRGQQMSCPVVLGSATPSLESWHKAKTGSYYMLQLPNRAYNGAFLPSIEIADVRHIQLDNGLLPSVWQALRDNFGHGGMSLVYVNRRGFAPVLFCGDCAHTFGCPNCSAKMVLHQRAGLLRCHHCGFRQPVPHQCPECGNQDLMALGQGTQRIEETLRLVLPDARILRIDRDTVSRKSDWDNVYRTVTEGRADILVGTQMLVKGHDFSRLNLVVVVNADGSLHSADFRASEHLFAQLVQVSGRAGRAAQSGHVMIQTALPNHAVFTALRTNDYAGFATAQLAERELFGLPPFGFQAAIRADAPVFADAATWLNEIKTELATQLPVTVVQMGVAPMLMVRLAERERAQIFLESPSRRDLHRAIVLWTTALQQRRHHSVRWHVDVDPQDM